MIKIILDKPSRVIKSKNKLEEILEVKISSRGKEIYLEGDGDKIYIAEKVVEALNFGFNLDGAILIAEEEFLLEILNIKDYTDRKDLERIRGRIIGKEGRTKKALIELTKCGIEVNGNQVGIIGPPENIQGAQEAIISLIKGAKQANVYAHLEKNQVKRVEDLGLKE